MGSGGGPHMGHVLMYVIRQKGLALILILTPSFDEEVHAH